MYNYELTLIVNFLEAADILMKLFLNIIDFWRPICKIDVSLEI